MTTTFRAAAAALVLLAIGGTAGAQAAPIKIGYVNTAALMAAAPGRVAAESTYSRELAAFQKQQQTWGDSLQKLFEGFQKAEPAMTAAKKQAEQEKIQKVQRDLANLNTLGEQKLQQRQNEVLAPLMEVVRAAIDEIRSEGGYAMIFSADENSPIVSADKNLDLTEKVVARLKTKAATTPAAPSAMAPAAVKKPPTR
ncbi:MAG TPA: OmpH family outer membrane protein [Gemmatimonadaceae bacterium]|nr:OmpH family outer membrane protein [Gemmatimonadaceae bacterium]